MIPYLVILLSLYLSIAVHEFGHAREVRRLGVDVVVHVGLPLPYLKKVRFLFSVFGYRICLFPIPFGGYIQPPKEFNYPHVKNPAISKDDYMLVAAAGLRLNFIIGFTWFFFYRIVQRDFSTRNIIAVILSWAIITMCISLPLFFARYIIPLLGVFFLGVILVDVIQSIGTAKIASKGNVEGFKIIAGYYNKIGVLGIFGLVNLLIGLLNVLIFPPLDGGNILLAHLKGRFSKDARTLYALVGTILFLMLIGVSFLGDLAYLFK